MTAENRYKSFIASKVPVVQPTGFEPRALCRDLFHFQRDLVRWSLRLGRAALFEDCGLGKSLQQLEWAREVCAETGGRVLILAPLAVTAQTLAEGKRFGITVHACRRQEDVQPGINITNYEMLEHFDASAFVGVVLDESSILKSYDSKTRNLIIESFKATKYRLACTATPAPNDFMELGNHAEFLGVMSRVEMLATFFVHDGGDTSKWRLKGHAAAEFWKWVCTWAAMVRKPSDLGYDDGDFKLPPLSIEQVLVETKVETVKEAGLLFKMEARTLIERRDARRASIAERVAAAAVLANGSTEQWMIWCDLNAEGDALVKAIPGAVQVSGADDNETKAQRALDFAAGKIRVLVSKASIFGWGLNFQNCSNTAFVGVSDSYEAFYQAVRRFWRFGQKKPVRCVVVASGLEGAVVRNLERKERDAAVMAEEMVKNMGDLTRENIRGTEKHVDAYKRETVKGDRWTVHLGDCVEVAKEIPAASVGYSIFSPPFASLYTYSASPRDMGNCPDTSTFYKHMGFLVKELFRVTKPGRLLSFHCMNLPASKVRDGFIGIYDFRGDLIRMFQMAGWIYHSEVCIWKDPVTAMQRTKALGLLYKQIKKDSAMSRQGIPDYLVTMRKPGVNPDPVTHEPEEFPVDLWQQYASPVWMDINPSNTLQHRSAREEKDERHICPLQLEVIERAVKLWSRPGDVVLSPFAGIGSELFVARQMGREALGIELKESYWRQAVANCRVASETEVGQLGLFRMPEAEAMHGVADGDGGSDFAESDAP